METKVRRMHAESLKTNLNFDGLYFVDGRGLGGSLALLWKDRGIAQYSSLVSRNNTLILKLIFLDVLHAWRLTCFYGFPERQNRQKSWDTLHTKSNLPWLVVGFFNDITSQPEKRAEGFMDTSSPY